MYIKQLHIEPSAKCQARCSVCPRVFKHNKVGNNITYKDYVDFLDPNLPVTLQGVVYCGNYGDPMMNPEMDKIAIHSIKTIGKNTPYPHVSVYTNGGIGRPQSYFEMGAAGISLKFAVEGTTQAIHERYRRGVDFSKLVENLTATREGMDSTNQRDTLLTLYVLPWVHTIADMENIVAFAKKYKANIQIEYPRHLKRGTPGFNVNDELIDVVFVTDNLDNVKWGEYGNNDRGNLIGSYDDLLSIDWGEPISFTEEQTIQRHTLGDGSLRRNRAKYIDTVASDFQLFNYYDENVTLACTAKQSNSLFINADMDLHPCCYLSLKIEAMHKKLPVFTEDGVRMIAKDTQDISFNLRDRELKSIIEDKRWLDMAFSYTEGKKIISHCEEICGKCKQS